MHVIIDYIDCIRHESDTIKEREMLNDENSPNDEDDGCRQKSETHDSQERHGCVASAG